MATVNISGQFHIGISPLIGPLPRNCSYLVAIAFRELQVLRIVYPLFLYTVNRPNTSWLNILDNSTSSFYTL